ncbi:ATP-dependent Clp protease [Dipodascopsis uninucleata]
MGLAQLRHGSQRLCSMLSQSTLNHRTGILSLSREFGYWVGPNRLPPQAAGGSQSQSSMHDGNEYSPNMFTIPTVPDRDRHGATIYFDIFSRLLKERIIMLSGPIEDRMASTIVAQLLYLEATDPTKPIYMYINSGGGEMHAGFSIVDTMQYIKCPVSTICVGLAASMASIILISGERGSRYALPNSWIMVHQPSSGMQGKASDLAIHARQILRMREQANRLLMDNLTKPYTMEQVEKLVENDNFFNASEAVDLGIVDEVIHGGKPINHGSGDLRQKNNSNSNNNDKPTGPSPHPAPKS